MQRQVYDLSPTVPLWGRRGIVPVFAPLANGMGDFILAEIVYRWWRVEARFPFEEDDALADEWRNHPYTRRKWRIRSRDGVWLWERWR